MLRNRTVTIIISLICAILLWAYVTGEVDPTTNMRLAGVPISIVNQEDLTERGLAVAPDDDMTVDIVIKGTRSRVNKAKKTGLKAYIDVSGCKEGKNECSITVNTPDGVTVDRMSEEKREITVDEITEKEFTAEVEFAQVVKVDSDKVPWIVAGEGEKVTVSGVESAVDNVDAVKGTIDQELITDEESKWIYVPISAFDEDGNEAEGVSLDDDSIRVHVSFLSAKSVELDLSAVHVKDGYKVEDIKSEEEVELVGDESDLKKLNKIKAKVDLSGKTESGETSVKLDLPDGVYLYDQDGYDKGSTIKVTFTLKGKK